MESGIDVPAPFAPVVASEIMTVNNRAGSVENLTPGFVREVTAYNVGVRGQTSDEPCIGARERNDLQGITSNYYDKMKPRTVTIKIPPPYSPDIECG